MPSVAAYSKRILIGLALAAIIVSGCAKRFETEVFRPPPPPAEPKISLARTDLEQREPLLHPTVEYLSGGTPILAQNSTSLRTLGFEQMRETARAQSLTAKAIENERRRFACLPDSPTCLLEVMDLQAEHERVQAEGKAAEAFVQLAGIYLQHDHLLTATSELESTARQIQKIKAAELPIEFSFDERSLHRRQNELEEKAAELLYGQNRSTHGLEILLNLQREELPIWTHWNPASPMHLQTPNLESELQTAWAHRKDLQALQRLSQCCDGQVLDLIQSSARSLHPLLGIGLARKQKRLFESREHFRRQRNQQACCQAVQIHQLIAAQKKLIEAEVANRVFSIEKRQRLIRVKQETLESLRSSIREADKAAEVKPLDFKAQAELKAKVLETSAAITAEVIQLELDRVKLRAVQGLSQSVSKSQ